MRGVNQFEDSPNMVTMEKFELLTEQHKCLLPMPPAFSEVTKCCTSL